MLIETNVGEANGNMTWSIKTEVNAHEIHASSKVQRYTNTKNDPLADISHERIEQFQIIEQTGGSENTTQSFNSAITCTCELRSDVNKYT